MTTKMMTVSNAERNFNENVTVISTCALEMRLDVRQWLRGAKSHIVHAPAGLHHGKIVPNFSDVDVHCGAGENVRIVLCLGGVDERMNGRPNTRQLSMCSCDL